MKGIHLSPDSEFKPGHDSGRSKPIGYVAIRTRSRDGRERAWVKIGEPNRWMLRARLTWISVNGPIPDGCLVHHRDRNPLNDDIANLEAMTRAEHLAEHRMEFPKRRKKNP